MSRTSEPQKKYEVAADSDQSNESLKKDGALNFQNQEVKFQDENKKPIKGSSPMKERNLKDPNVPYEYSSTSDSIKTSATSSLQNKENIPKDLNNPLTFNQVHAHRGSILKKSRYGSINEPAPKPIPHAIPTTKDLKGDKKEKISFKEDLQQVKIVENWKDYNSDNYDSPTCHCSTF